MSAPTDIPAAAGGRGVGGLVVRVIGHPITASAGLAVTSVLTAEWIDAGGQRHDLPVLTADAPEMPKPADIHVEMDQHVVVHDLPDGRLHTESVIRVVVHQDGEQQVVERHDEQIISKQYSDTDLVIEQDDAVRVQLDDEGDVDVDLAGGMRVSEQPANPWDVFPDGGVVVVQDQDLVVTDIDDGVFDDVEDAAVLADFDQSARSTGNPDDGEIDPISISQDQAKADRLLDSTPPGSSVGLSSGAAGSPGSPHPTEPFPADPAPVLDQPFHPGAEPRPDPHEPFRPEPRIDPAVDDRPDSATETSTDPPGSPAGSGWFDLGSGPEATGAAPNGPDADLGSDPELGSGPELNSDLSDHSDLSPGTTPPG